LLCTKPVDLYQSAIQINLLLCRHLLQKSDVNKMKYPSHLIREVEIQNGIRIYIRPIRPEDGPLEQDFVRGLSEETKYFRFMSTMNELTDSMISKFINIDYDREMAFIAVKKAGEAEIEVGVCRFCTLEDGKSCEFSVVVADDWKHLGVRHALMSILMEVAEGKNLEYMTTELLARDIDQLELLKDLGFEVEATEDLTIKKAGKHLMECAAR